MSKITDINARSRPADAAPDLDDAQRMQQIRELLCGQQAREHEYQMKEIESRLETVAADLKQERENRIQHEQKLAALQNDSVNERRRTAGALRMIADELAGDASPDASAHTSANASISNRLKD